MVARAHYSVVVDCCDNERTGIDESTLHSSSLVKDLSYFFKCVEVNDMYITTVYNNTSNFESTLHSSSLVKDLKLFNV